MAMFSTESVTSRRAAPGARGMRRWVRRMTTTRKAAPMRSLKLTSVNGPMPSSSPILMKANDEPHTSASDRNRIHTRRSAAAALALVELAMDAVRGVSESGRLRRGTAVSS